MLKEFLQKIGMSDKEATVYLASLQIGSQPVSLIARKAGLNRSTTYLILDSLRRKGIISQYVKGDIKYFEVISPEKLLGYLELKKIDLEGNKSELLELIPQFLSLINPKIGKPRVQFYEGLEGIKEVYEDTLNDPNISELLSFWAIDKVPKAVMDYLKDSYIPRRAKMNIKAYAIAPDTPLSRKLKALDKKQKRGTSVLIPAKKCGFYLELNIYGHKVAFMSYEKKEMIALIIESEVISDAMRKIYKLCYQLAGEKYSGF